MTTQLENPAAEAPPIALDTAGAAKALCLSRAWLAQLRLRGGGPRYVKVGKKVLYRPSDLAVWLDDNARRSTST